MVSSKNPISVVKGDDTMSNENAYNMSVQAPSSYNGMISPADIRREKELEEKLQQNKKQFDLESGH